MAMSSTSARDHDAHHVATRRRASRGRVLAVGSVLAVIAASACSQLPGATGVCTSDLSWRLAPRERTLRVGETFTPELALFGCGGSERLSDVATWSAADARLTAVDARSGRVTALAVGQGTVTVTTERYGVRDAIVVTVVDR
jgi:hypothetical protein